MLAGKKVLNFPIQEAAAQRAFVEYMQDCEQLKELSKCHHVTRCAICSRFIGCCDMYSFAPSSELLRCLMEEIKRRVDVETGVGS